MSSPRVKIGVGWYLSPRSLPVLTDPLAVTLAPSPYSLALASALVISLAVERCHRKPCGVLFHLIPLDFGSVLAFPLSVCVPFPPFLRLLPCNRHSSVNPRLPSSHALFSLAPTELKVRRSNSSVTACINSSGDRVFPRERWMLRR